MEQVPRCPSKTLAKLYSVHGKYDPGAASQQVLEKEDALFSAHMSPHVLTRPPPLRRAFTDIHREISSSPCFGNNQQV